MVEINHDFGYSSFQLDLIRQKYHIFNFAKVDVPDFYPPELLDLVIDLDAKRSFKLKVGDVVTVRAFFAISEPIGDKCAYESGLLDAKLAAKEGKDFVGTIRTVLPERFHLKKGDQITVVRKNVFYKQK